MRKDNNFVRSFIYYYDRMRLFFDLVCMSFLVFFMRIWIAKIFWYSGLTKITSWQTTVFLFKDEYKVPFLPPELAAVLATIFELGCPVLLVMGLATRFATLPLLGMTAVIQFTYLQHTDHLYWAILLGTLLFYGPGSLSLDRYIEVKFAKRLRG